MINDAIKDYIKQKKSKNIFSNRKIEMATIEILTACNFRCIHCYNQDLKKRYLKVNLFKNIIDQLVDSGCQSVTITGGEPLLHPNFSEIYNYCFKKGLKVSLFTNGYYVDKYIELFKSFIPKKVEISLYGTNNATYKKYVKLKMDLKRFMLT